MSFLKKLIAISIIFFTVLWSFSDILPSFSVKNETLKPTSFSINNALYHLKNISKKSHHPGTDEHKVVQNYLVNELQKIGLTPELQTETVFNKKWKAGTTVENIIATIKGTSNGKSLLLLSHYDSNPHSSLGASDAGSGIVTILEGIRAFLAENRSPKNDIIILFSDAEELGLLGAQAFVNSHPLAKNVGLVLNFEARGSGGSSYMLMETNGKNSKLLTEFIKAKPNFPAANSLMYSVYKMLPNDTDLTVFREAGNINGFNFAFIGDHFDYHTAQDSYERMDRESLAHQADYLTSTLNYFANANLNNLNSNEDLIFVNFPFVKLLSYPFSWVLPMLITAIIIFLILIFFGIKNNKITVNGLLKSFAPFTLSLMLCGGISFVLWKLLLIIHPQYQDILHGFTYNGYQYLVAFSFLSLWLVFKIYNVFKNEKTTDLLIAPITFWIIINFLIYKYLQGAGFFILPVFIALFMLAVLLFTNLKKANHPVLFALISIPIVYMFAPLIKMFPVGLGLKNVFISAILIVLVFGLLLPVFHQQKKKMYWQTFFGFCTILVFTIATFNSGFSIDKKKPNSLVYVQNENEKTAYFATYNNTLDAYTKQVFSEGYNKGGIPTANTKSKYNTHFKYHKKTQNKGVNFSEVYISIDTIIGNEKLIEFTLKPQRKVSKFELFNNTPISIKELCVNGAFVNNGNLFKAKKQTLISYTMANTNTELKVSLKVAKNDKPNITFIEISNDLLTHPKFKIQPRSETMMPMPFVTNDAIICTKTLEF